METSPREVDRTFLSRLSISVFAFVMGIGKALATLAWKIATAGAMTDLGVGQGRPLTFWQAAAFQWINPKAWIMVVGAASAYAPWEDFGRNVVVLAIILDLVNASSICVWAGFGTALRPFLA